MMFEAGDRVVVHSDLYGGTYRLFQNVFRNKGIEAVYVDLRDFAATERELRARRQSRLDRIAHQSR